MDGGGDEENQGTTLLFILSFIHSRFYYICWGRSKVEKHDTNGYGQGQVENELTDYENNNNSVEVYIARPGMVLARGMSLRSLIFGMGPSIWVDGLAKVLVDVAVRGDVDGGRVLENEEMLRWDH